ncbi:transporter [Nocardia panacis]|uniref:Transporter n=2 Tax=Nocardia panacis TaxID=2340916 RepID=A0A3A4KXP9_9NOCA|nr:transporter [Nocardia panacis]
MVLASSGRVVARALVVVLAVLATSCGVDDDGPTTIAVGTDNSEESNLLAQIYSGALARAGARTEVRGGFRPEQLRRGLDAGDIQVTAAHSGALLAELDSGAPQRKPDKVMKALSAALPEGLVVSDPADGTDMRPRLLVTAAEPVRTAAELIARCPESTVGIAAQPGLLALPKGLAKLEGCEPAATVALSDPAALRTALRDGTIQVGLLAGPPIDPATTEGLVSLTDKEYLLRAEQIVPVFRKGALDQRRVKKLNYVAGELNTADLCEMIRRMRTERATAAELAVDWLDKHGL